MQNTLRFNAKIIAFKRNLLRLILMLFAFKCNLLRLNLMLFAFKRNLLRLNAKIIAIKRNKKNFFLYSGLNGLPYILNAICLFLLSLLHSILTLFRVKIQLLSVLWSPCENFRLLNKARCHAVREILVVSYRSFLNYSIYALSRSLWILAQW